VRRERSRPISSVPFLASGKPFRVEAVVFDLDGTLTQPGGIDFARVHELMGCPREQGLLEFLAAIDEPEVRRRKEAILVKAELEAVERCRPNAGAPELVAFLREHGIPMGIVTRNCRLATEKMLRALVGINPEDFAVVVTRDDPWGPKPIPDSILFVASRLGTEPHTLLVVGDHAFDIEAGKKAGALTMFVRNGADELPPELEADFSVDNLSEALDLLRYGVPLAAGKLPAALLEAGLSSLVSSDPSLLIGARIGEDAAVLDVAEEEVLVLASDPITLASDCLARYTVIVNANDVATTGATPRWLLTTLLFPPGSSASEVLALVRDLQNVCATWGITLCGGHTEVSAAVSRPVVVGTMAGTALRSELKDKRRARTGERLLMTKAAGVEGTGLLAREFPERLRAAGWSEAEIARCASFLDLISVLEEARIARSFPGVSALHDVTEGGVATAVRELSAACGHRLQVHLDQIPLYPETERICRVFGLDPLGLIGSGSLLITCAPNEVLALRQALETAGIAATEIGEVLEEGEGVEVCENGRLVDWPYFERDEVSRLESQKASEEGEERLT